MNDSSSVHQGPIGAPGKTNVRFYLDQNKYQERCKNPRIWYNKGAYSMRAMEQEEALRRMLPKSRRI